MNDTAPPSAVPVSRPARVAIGVFAVVAALTVATGWAVDASAAGNTEAVRCTPAPGGDPSGCLHTGTTSTEPPPTSTGPASTQTSYRWTFEDGQPGGWYGTSRNGYGTGPWLTPSPAAAASGRTGLLVGGGSAFDTNVAVSVTRSMVKPGTYTATARVRLAPGQRGAPFEVSGPPRTSGTYVTDGAWVTLTGTIAVPDNGTSATLVVGTGHGFCSSPNDGDFAWATSFHLDDVVLTRSGDSTTPITQTPTATGAGCPTYSPLPRATAKIHYEVTSTGWNGFSATLVLTNLNDAPIRNWAVPFEAGNTGRRITWVSGARAAVVGTPTSLQTELVGSTGGPDIPAHGQVRISVGITGSPVGSADLFTRIEGQQTGTN